MLAEDRGLFHPQPGLMLHMVLRHKKMQHLGQLLLSQENRKKLP
jgi:hypothetical protein